MIAACLKWVDHRPDVDRLSGAVHHRARTSGPSAADLAALEWALVLGERTGDEVVAVTAGPAECEAMLRDALGAGASRAIRVDVLRDAPSDTVARALAGVLGGASFVVTGNWSIDRGSGSVPAFLAAHLGAAQALGLAAVSIEDGDGVRVLGERRLDGGRRERVRVRAPAVLSVEATTARLRRAPLSAVVAAGAHTIEVVDAGQPSTAVSGHAFGTAQRGPFRPRPRVLPPPPAGLSARERVLALTGALAERTPPRVLALEPDEAAEAILEQLRAWGYVE